jgi:hypothetical protein
MDFDAVAEELYAGPREAFIATRAERAAEAKKDGDAELARRIKELRKPSIAAWLVNRLARQHADELADLAELGEQLRQAHEDLDGERLRELSTRKRAAVERLADRVRSLGPEPTSGVLDQVAGTLEAAVSNADVAATVAAGRLDSAVAPSGFEQWLIAPVGSGPRGSGSRGSGSQGSSSRGAGGSGAGGSGGVRAGGSAGPTPVQTPPDDSPRERRRQQRLAELTEQAAAADAVREAAEGELATLTDAAEQAAATAAELQARLAAAEREARKRREAAGAARRAYDSAVRAADAARKAVQRLDLR